HDRNHGGNAIKPLFFGLDGCKAGWFVVGIHSQQLNRKLSRQSWAIAPKIKEVDEYMCSVRPGEKVREMHPEVAFWALNGKTTLNHKKKEQAGVDERLGILQGHYPNAGECFRWAREQYLIKEVATDDILDAMVGAVTAMQYPRLSTLPAMPMLDEERLPMEIVYCSEFRLVTLGDDDLCIQNRQFFT
ncbi:MAG: hypothetical protein DRR42_25965, partial [Gammaproteobacteria bacterium]